MKLYLYNELYMMHGCMPASRKCNAIELLSQLQMKSDITPGELIRMFPCLDSTTIH